MGDNWEETLSFQGYQPSPHIIALMNAGQEPSEEDIRQDFLQQQQQQQEQQQQQQNNDNDNSNLITQLSPPSDDDDPDYHPESTDNHDSTSTDTPDSTGLDSAGSSSGDTPQAEGNNLNEDFEGDSNGRMYLLNLAALTLQRDTPNRPTDAVAAARPSPSAAADAQNHSLEEQQQQQQREEPIYPNLPEEDYTPERLASSLLLVPLISNPAYTNVYTDMGRSHPLPQSLEAASSVFNEVINNQFDWTEGTPQPVMNADQMASAFQEQTADGLLPNLLKRFRDQMKTGGGDGGSDDSGGDDDDSEGKDICGSDSEEDESEEERELKEKRAQRNRIKLQHESNKGYHMLFNWYKDYLVNHGAELRQSHLANRNECRTLRQKLVELKGKGCDVS